MRYPAGKSNQDFLANWYDAQPFGSKTSYGYHEGHDYNKNTGGNSDMNEPLVAVADGKIVYYHQNSHPTSGFGRHMVLECDTTRGKRWYHYSHCNEITAQVKEVKEGDIIGKLGNTGTTYAHLHFAVFKANPSTLYKGIDSIARNKTELDSNWEKFEILEQAPETPEENKTLLEWTGINNEEKAIEEMVIHLGEKDKKCNWGSDSGAGYLGQERAKSKKLEGEKKELQEQLAICQSTSKAQGSELKKQKEKYEEYVQGLIEQIAPLPIKYKGTELSKEEIIKQEIKELIDIGDNYQKMEKKVLQLQDDVKNAKAEAIKEVEKSLDSLKEKHRIETIEKDRQINNLSKQIEQIKKEGEDEKETMSLIGRLLEIFRK